MAGNFIGVEERGSHEAAVRIRGVAEVAHHRLKEVADDAADEAADVMRSQAPRRSGNLSRRVDSTDAVWHAGGAGGGGYWEALAGVKDDGDDYPLAVFYGSGQKKVGGLGNIGELTGNLGELVRASGAGRITPASGNVFPIHIMSGIIFRPWQSGQAPQQQWVINAQAAADAVVKARFTDIVREHRG